MSDSPANSAQLHFIWGGVFTDASFTTLEPGTEEAYGPYHDARTADRIWNEKARRNIDVASHRLFVLTVDRPGGVTGS